MIYRLEIGNQSHKIEILKDISGNIQEILVDDQKFIASEINLLNDVKIIKKNDFITVETKKESFEIKLNDIESSDFVESDDNRHIDQMKEFFKNGKLISPLPGKIVDIRVKEGSEIELGKVIIALEAMKMENEIITPSKMKITKILVSIGDSVVDKQVLIEYEQSM